MTLLHPTMLLWGLLAIPLILFGVVQRRNRHAISSSLVWDAVLAERTWLERARRPIVLALRIAALELLVIAAADPRLNSTDADVLILVLDVSASMQAQDAGGSRFDQVRADVRHSIDNLRPGQRMALLSAGSVTRVECGLTSDRDRLRAALDSTWPTDGTADLSAAIALAEDLIPDSRHGRIIVATAGAAGAPGPHGRGADIDWVVADSPVENVGITLCEIRPRPSDPAEVELLIEVLNAGSRAVSCPLTIDFRGATVDRSKLEIAPGETFRKIELINNPLGGLLVAQLNHADALAVDNVAAVQVPERRRTRIALVTPGNRAVEAALASLPGIDLTVLSDVPDARPLADLLVWDGKVPARVPPGPNLVLAPSTNCDLWRLGTVAIGSAVVLDQVESPQVAHVDFTEAVLEDPIRLDFMLPARSLVICAAGDPIYSLLERATGNVLVLHLRIDKTDLAARGALPVLFADALRSFGLNAARYGPAVTTADMVSIPPVDPARRLLPPNDARGKRAVDSRLDVKPGQGIVGPLDRVGLWRVVPMPAQTDDKAAPATAIASQLTDRSQTDLNAARVRRSAAAGSALESGGWSWPMQLDGRLWPCCVVFALVLLAVEGFLGRWSSGQ